MTMHRLLRIALAGVGATLVAGACLAQKKYDPGADDKEIRIGAIHPYSGPASAYATMGKAIGAYFDKVNDEGGINGRRIRYVPTDDGYNPAKTVEMARKLVEEDEVLLVFSPLGTATNSAIHKYMNQQKVPQLFVSSGAAKWDDPKHFPYTMGWQPSYVVEARIYARHILETRPNARIAVLYQNDDFGKDYLKGLDEGLGDRAKAMVVATASYEATDPTVDSQLVSLKASGADVLLDVTTPKFAALAIRKVAEMGWKPVHYLSNVSGSIGGVLMPAGLDNSVGILTLIYIKHPLDPQWVTDKGVQDWLAWMKKYYPAGNVLDTSNVTAYSMAQTLVQVLKQCGDDLTRANVMRQAARLDLELPMLLPGLRVRTSPEDFRPVAGGQLARFDGKAYQRFGKVYDRGSP